jgi:aminopeptidase YwaD
VARKGIDAARWVVLSAHIDAKRGTPGALDNAAGVVVLLLLAELLHDHDGRLGIELVALNGEDYYAAPGEISYLEHNRGKMGDILLNINLDAPGYRVGSIAYSLYECPKALAAAIRGTLSGRAGIIEGDPWYQGDHMVFVQNQVPALAITSEHFMDIETSVAHTALDTPELVDPHKLVGVALALRGLLLALDREIPR